MFTTSILGSLSFHKGHDISHFQKRVKTWVERKSALTYGTVWRRTRLKTNVRAPPKQSHDTTQPPSPQVTLYCKRAQLCLRKIDFRLIFIVVRVLFVRNRFKVKRKLFYTHCECFFGKRAAFAFRLCFAECSTCVTNCAHVKVRGNEI